MTSDILKNMEAINNAIADLKRIYNDGETTMNEMKLIIEYTKLLDITDFTKTVTE